MADDSPLASKCLDFCRHLASQGLTFTFSLAVGPGFTFSLDTKEKTSSANTEARKKLSPSSLKRNAERKDKFLKKNPPPTTKDTAASKSAAACEVAINAEATVKKAQLIKCEHCDFEAETLQHLKVHVNFKHQGFKCDYCEYKNISKDILKEHMQKKHKNHRTRSPPRHPRNSSPPRAFGR
jgi:hypothetical protein